MPKKTDFLKLVLPELNEFVNSWHQPVNENSEKIDDWTSDLYESLVGSSDSATWATLRGDFGSLADRLDVSINSDGTVDVSGSQDILDITTSAYRGQFSNPRDRLNDSDAEIYEARQPVIGDRFTPMSPSGPSASFPPDGLDASMALRSMDFGARSSEPVSSPGIPWAPGLVVGGADPFITANAIGQVKLNAGNGAIFNIDGFVFRLREDLILDYSLLSGLSDNDYVWIFVSRDGSDYANPNYKYDGPGGVGTAVKDLRKLQTGAVGITSGSTFSDATAKFNTAVLGKVKTGDVLVITSGTAAGSYVINALDGTTPDTKLTIKGTFPTNISGAAWYVHDQNHPQIGAFVTDGDPTTRPDFAAGRVYIGRIRHKAAGNPDQLHSFRRGGVYDSGWQAATATTGTLFTADHDLGVEPSHVELWVRTGPTARAYQPVVQRQVVTNVVETNTTLDPGDTKKATLLIPSMYAHCSETEVKVEMLNASTDPAKPVALFTDSGGTDRTTGYLRVIARR